MENSTGKKFVPTRDKFRRGIEEGGGSLFRTEDRETKKLKFPRFKVKLDSHHASATNRIASSVAAYCTSSSFPV